MCAKRRRELFKTGGGLQETVEDGDLPTNLMPLLAPLTNPLDNVDSDSLNMPSTSGIKRKNQIGMLFKDVSHYGKKKFNNFL